MGIFGLIFIILPIILLLIVLGIGVTLVRGILRMFGLGAPSRWDSRQYAAGDSSANGRQSDSKQQTSSTAPPKNKKVIDEDEGEYVEFEEVR